MKIDIHAHFLCRDYVEELQQVLQLRSQTTPDGKTLYRRNGASVLWSRADMFDDAHRLRDMDAKGIDMRVLSLSTPNVYPWPGQGQARMARRMNDALARICRAHPDRLVGLASLPMNDVGAALQEIDRATGELGLKGLAIGSNIDGVPLSAPQYEPLWARIDQLRLPVFEHPMFPKDVSDMQEFELPLRVGLVFETTLVATRLIYAGIFERYPNFPYILAHTGGALLMLLARLDNGYRLFPDCRAFITRPPSDFVRGLYYDTASFDAETLMLAVRTVGADRLLFATDDPFIGADTRHVDTLPVTDQQRAAILGGNAARLLGLS